MTVVRDWTVNCKDCGKPFKYSATSARDAEARGESRPERCLACRRSHNLSTSRMGAPYIDLAPGYEIGPDGLKPGRLGKLKHPNRPHRPDEILEPNLSPNQFGVTDQLMVEYLNRLDHYQVSIVVAPTGSGKSTFFPFRMLNPPSPLPSDYVTRHGRIVVTQPRIEASSSIPQFVATRLHGTTPGPGRDIGFRNSRSPDQTDSRNKLVYLTDGTLLNMIRKGELHDVGVIVIDEAHERSLNIDLILALLRRELHALPHLKLVIASATINADQFREFFAPDFDVLVTDFPGKPGFPVTHHFRESDPIPQSQAPARMPREVATRAHEILRWMICGEAPPGLAGVEAQVGDILCFLHGKRPIREAIDLLREDIDADDDLTDKVDVLPLHAELPQAAITRALHRQAERQQGDPKFRVIVATNIAETSLTVEGIRHVIDSGLINHTTWDPATMTQSVAPGFHSRSGLLQRRGRAGRVAPGMWHCLLTEAQFGGLPYDSPPEIVRAPLEAVVLAASSAGVGDPASLKWVPPGPPPEELRRATATLRSVGALDSHGDATPLGRELSGSREPLDRAALLACADITGCAVEAAVVLAAMNAGGTSRLIMWNKGWPPAAKSQVDGIHQALLLGAKDDLDAILSIWAEWERTLPADRDSWAASRFLSAAVLKEIERGRDRLLEPLQARTKTKSVRLVRADLAARLRQTIAWSMPNSMYQCGPDGSYIAAVGPRSDAALIHELHANAQVTVDNTSRCHALMPARLIALQRFRRKVWISPLEPPKSQVHVSFCVSLDGLTPAKTGPLLLSVVDSPAVRDWRHPVALPGQRFGVRDNGSSLTVLERLDPQPIIAEVLDIDDPDEFVPDDEDITAGVELAYADEGETDASAWDDDFEADVDEATPLSGRRTKQDVAAEGLVGATLPRPRSQNVSIEAIVIAPPRGDDERVGFQADDGEVRYERFANEHQPGSEVTLRVIDATQFQGGSDVVVRVQDPALGLAFPLDRRAFGIGVRDSQLSTLVGQSLRFTVEAVDPVNRMVELSRRRAVLVAIESLAQTGSVQNAVIVDALDDAVFVSLDSSASDPIITWRVLAGRLPPRPQDMSLGQTVRIKIAPPQERTLRHWVGKASKSVFADTVFSLDSTRLVCSRRVPLKDVEDVMRRSQRLPLAEGLRVRNAAWTLALLSRLPRLVKVIDVTGIKAVAQVGQSVGKVRRVDQGAIYVTVDGVDVRVPEWEVSWTPGDAANVTVGASVPVFVQNADPENDRLKVSLFPKTSIAIPPSRQRLISKDRPMPPFRDLADERSFVLLKGTVLEIRSASVDAQKKTIDAIMAALTGPLVQISVPTKENLRDVKRQCGVIATYEQIQGQTMLVAACPSQHAANAFFKALQIRYAVTALMLGQIPKGALAAARAQGLPMSVSFDQKGPSGIPAIVFRNPDQVMSKISVLEDLGITYSSVNAAPNDRVRMSLIEGAAVTPLTGEQAMKPRTIQPARGGVSSQVSSGAAPVSQFVRMSSTALNKLTKARGFLWLGQSRLETIQDDFGVTIRVETNGVLVNGDAHSVVDAVRRIQSL